MKNITITKILSVFLVLLMALCACDAPLDTNPDWSMESENNAAKYEFSSLSDMEDYLIKGRLPDGIHKKLNRVFPLPAAGQGYIPFGELFEARGEVVGATARNDGLWYTDIDVLCEVDSEAFSAYDFQFYYDLEGVRVMVTRSTSYVNRSATQLLTGITQVVEFGGFEGEDDALLRRCGDTEVVYLMSDGEISGAFVVICDRYIRIVANSEEGLNVQNEIIEPLFSTEDEVFERAVNRMVKAVSRHSEVTKKDAYSGMSTEKYLEAVHGGAFIVCDRSAFLTKDGSVVAVAFKKGKINEIEMVDLPADLPSNGDFEKIPQGMDYVAVLGAVGMPCGVWHGEKDTLEWYSAEGNFWHLTFDQYGKVSEVKNWSEYKDSFFY